MQNKSIFIWVTIAVVIIGAVVVIVKNQNSGRQLASQQEKTAMIEKDSSMMEDTTMENTNKKDDMMVKDSMQKESPSTYVDYSPQVLADAETAQKSGRKVVLFFHASWCPFCIAADKDFKANINTDKFPVNVTLIKTDYDSQTELKKKYGVTYQHTFVQIDSSGNQITKWTSGETSELKTNIK